MQKIDVNCLLGHWPFRRIRKNTFEDLINIHQKAGISHGYLASLNSIFYNDPFEGDEELHEIIKNTGYRHILTVNPTLPGYAEDIRRGIELFDIKGVKIYPGYHGYSLEDRNLKNLCGILKEAGLPLFLSIRMEDERLDYILRPQPPSTRDISAFLSLYPGNKVLLLNVRYGELLDLKEVMDLHPNAFYDVSGLKDGLFAVEKLVKVLGFKNMLYGSLHPLFCLKSTLLLVENAEVSRYAVDGIFNENTKRFFLNT